MRDEVFHADSVRDVDVVAAAPVDVLDLPPVVERVDRSGVLHLRNVTRVLQVLASLDGRFRRRAAVVVADEHDRQPLAERLHAFHDELDALDARLGEAVVGVSVDEAELASRRLVRKDHPQARTDVLRAPAERTRNVGRLRKPEHALFDEIEAALAVGDRRRHVVVIDDHPFRQARLNVATLVLMHLLHAEDVHVQFPDEGAEIALAVFPTVPGLVIALVVVPDITCSHAQCEGFALRRRTTSNKRRERQDRGTNRPGLHFHSPSRYFVMTRTL